MQWKASSVISVARLYIPPLFCTYRKLFAFHAFLEAMTAVNGYSVAARVVLYLQSPVILCFFFSQAVFGLHFTRGTSVPFVVSHVIYRFKYYI